MYRGRYFREAGVSAKVRLKGYFFQKVISCVGCKTETIVTYGGLL